MREMTERKKFILCLKNENVFGFVNNENRIDVNVSMKDDDGVLKEQKRLHTIWPNVSLSIANYQTVVVPKVNLIIVI